MTLITVLEPELEEEAKTFTANQRRCLATVYERWAAQLRVSAAIMEGSLKIEMLPQDLGPVPPLQKEAA